MVNNIAKYLQFQKEIEAVSKSADFKFGSWGSTGGCPKCRHSKFGSTCCNPDKLKAKKRAEQMFADKANTIPVAGSCDPKDYAACLEQVYAEIAADRGLPKIPTCKDPAGGEVYRWKNRI